MPTSYSYFQGWENPCVKSPLVPFNLASWYAVILRPYDINVSGLWRPNYMNVYLVHNFNPMISPIKFHYWCSQLKINHFHLF